VLFAILSILWILPSIGAVCILYAGRSHAVSLEQWIAVLLLASHVLFAFFAWRLRGFKSLRG